MQPTVAGILLTSAAYADTYATDVSVLLDGYTPDASGFAAATAELRSHAADSLAVAAAAFTNAAQQLSAVLGSAVSVSANPLTAELRASLHVTMTQNPDSVSAAATDNLFSGAVTTGVFQAALQAQGYAALTVLPSDPLQAQRNAAALAAQQGGACGAQQLQAPVACAVVSPSSNADRRALRAYKAVAIAFVVATGVLLCAVAALLARVRSLSAAADEAKRVAAGGMSPTAGRGHISTDFSLVGPSKQQQGAVVGPPSAAIL